MWDVLRDSHLEVKTRYTIYCRASYNNACRKFECLQWQ